MPAFDGDNFSPPAPVASVALRAIQATEIVSDVLLLIDTGADVTLIPRGAIEQLGVTPNKTQYELAGFDGQRTLADSVDLDLLVFSKVIRGCYLITEDSMGVLGRDVLNLFKLTFDGPTSSWDCE